MIRSPLCASRLHKCDPTKPAPPVTSMVFILGKRADLPRSQREALWYWGESCAAGHEDCLFFGHSANSTLIRSFLQRYPTRFLRAVERERARRQQVRRSLSPRATTQTNCRDSTRRLRRQVPTLSHHLRWHLLWREHPQKGPTDRPARLRRILTESFSSWLFLMAGPVSARAVE